MACAFWWAENHSGRTCSALALFVWDLYVCLYLDGIELAYDFYYLVYYCLYYLSYFPSFASVMDSTHLMDRLLTTLKTENMASDMILLTLGVFPLTWDYCYSRSYIMHPCIQNPSSSFVMIQLRMYILFLSSNSLDTSKVHSVFAFLFDLQVFHGHPPACWTDHCDIKHSQVSSIRYGVYGFIASRFGSILWLVVPISSF